MKSVSVKNILHIDDDADNHEIFYEDLREVGDDVNYHASTDAEEALYRLKEKEMMPDVIFLDLNMPKMNGQEFLAEVKKCEMLSSIPVVVLSSATLPQIIESTKRLGAKRYVTKPDNFSGFVSMLSSVLVDFSTNSIVVWLSIGGSVLVLSA